ncbi:LytTR family transcriptional regulator [Elizabethkingia anophelis]|uniref:LytTR family DNA-binding domain-containing protein n=1 Tax=Elizabethkingia anophelis TaxID=1117645 RepID=UPI00099ADD8C|nr:LytTR family DNA-binding domain-containing protein [Elizabethkingia anophelis]MCT4011796.1 LytTR family transcriptional regulator [Elizabethkingia anophelis]MDV3897221.1 LytTR family transcriptional regulator [Elizabethkingia anophelis]OPC49626.1 histidine kinase [Elizabethkingia anophelis]
MKTQAIYSIFQSRQKYIFVVCSILFIAANIILDYLFTVFQNSSFYFSESLLFSSYWIIYILLAPLFFKLVEQLSKITSKLLLTSSAIVLHLIIYPALVWVISEVFYNHTFPYWQTFNFTISVYFIKTVIIYGFLLVIITIYSQKLLPPAIAKRTIGEDKTKNFISSLIVSDSNSKKIVLAVDDIFYFSANSPYINIYHHSKKYLHTETLKSLESQLNDNQFVRIHKSCIVNINKIISIQSRQNGDYDVTLLDNTILRVSRSYAMNFKDKFSQQHRVTTK